MSDLSFHVIHGTPEMILVKLNRKFTVCIYMFSIHRKKRALNAEWKAYRQGIEWRCRWLALRVKELQAESSKYDRILALSKKQKEQYLDQQQDGSAARISTIIGYTHKNRILRRKRRRKAEEVIDLKSYMSKHPVFSRYGKLQP